MRVLVCIYGHPEAYPPTLNAIHQLSLAYDEIHVLHRPHLPPAWCYPSNVHLVPSGNYMPVRVQEEKSLVTKVLLFIGFMVRLLYCAWKNRPELILIYDAIPLLAFRNVRRFIPGHPIIWYHNHDIIQIELVRKMSISWWAALSEKSSFKWINMFSLPSEERKPFFQLNQFSGQYFFIPNYPALINYNRSSLPEPSPMEIRLIYQGAVAPGRGLEVAISILDELVNEKKIRLFIFGISSETFKNKLVEIANNLSVAGQLHFDGYTNYTNLIKRTNTCHIGLSFYEHGSNVNEKTYSTASNKFYEYAASGLPVLFLRKMNNFESSWAIPTNLEKSDLLKNIEYIDKNYLSLSKAAKNDFVMKYNFERIFSEPLQWLKNHSRVNSKQFPR